MVHHPKKTTPRCEGATIGTERYAKDTLLYAPVMRPLVRARFRIPQTDGIIPLLPDARVRPSGLNATL